MPHLPPYPTFPQITTTRLLLRELNEKDIPHILEITSFRGKRAQHVSEAMEMFEKIQVEYMSGRGVPWGIEIRETGEVIGTCGFYRGFENGAGEIGYILLEKFRGQGFMTEVVKAVTQFGFGTMHLKEIFAVTSAKNPASHNVLSKCGFTTDGVPDERGDVRFNRLLY